MRSRLCAVANGASNIELHKHAICRRRWARKIGKWKIFSSQRKPASHGGPFALE